RSAASQSNNKAGAASRAVFSRDAPSVGFNDSMHNGQPQAGASVLGCKEWIEDIFDGGGWNSRAVVVDGDASLIAVPLCANADEARRRSHASFGRGVGGPFADGLGRV